MATNVISAKLNLDIGNFKSKMQDAKKSIQDLQKSIKDTTSKDADIFDATDLGKKIGDIKTKFENVAKVIKALPTPAKVLACVVAVGVALKKVYEMGKQRFFTGLQDISSTLQPVISTLSSLGSQIKSTFESLTGTQLNLSSFATIGVTYEDTMARVQGITQTTGKEFEALKDKAREMGANTRYSATEAGEAMIQMGQQGWSAGQIMSGVKDVLNLATVGNISLADSAELVTNTMNALGMEIDADGKNVQRFADVVAQASVKSGTSVSQFAEAMTNVGSTAGALKIPIEDLSVGIGLMGNNMIKGSSAGTSMKTFLANMAKPTKEMTTCLSKYNLEGARQKILSGDLVGGYRDMAKSLDGLTEAEKTQIAATLAGKEGMAGLLAIIGKGEKPIKELEKAMEDSANVAQHMADTFDNTLKGTLMSISSAIQEKVLQVFDAIKPAVMEASGAFLDFMRAWNEGDLEGGLGQLEDKVSSWSKNIPGTIDTLISSINSFINGGALDSILNMGGDIVQGICDGIIRNKDNINQGISDLISKICDWINTNGPAIQEAGATILDAIQNGINKNSSKINQAADTIYDIVNTWVSKKKGAISALGTACFDAFIEGVIKGKVADATEFLENIFNPDQVNKKGLGGGRESQYLGSIDSSKVKESAKKTTDIYKKEIESQLNDGSITKAASVSINKALDQGEKARENASKTGQGYISELQEKLTTGNISETAYTSILNGLKQAEAAKIGATDTVTAYINDLEAGLMNGTVDPSSISSILQQLQSSESVRQSGSALANEFITSAQQALVSGQISPEEFNALVFGDIESNAQKWNDNGKQIGEGMTYGVEEALKNMNVEELQNLQMEYENLAACLDSVSAQMETSLSTIATSTRTEMLSCANITRNQFLNMTNIVRNQCVNMANIVRNQFVNIANVVNNQALNARNNATRSFMSMKSVISTQVGESRTVVVSKFMSIAAVVNTQSWNARDNACRAFMSLAAVVRTQMSSALSSVRSYMSQIASATNRTLSLKVDVAKTITTTTVNKATQSLMQRANQSMMGINQASMMSYASSPTLYSTPFATSSSTVGSAKAKGSKESIILELPVNIDGRQVAKASAIYMDGELKIINDRKNRYAGGGVR